MSITACGSRCLPPRGVHALCPALSLRRCDQPGTSSQSYTVPGAGAIAVSAIRTKSEPFGGVWGLSDCCERLRVASPSAEIAVRCESIVFGPVLEPHLQPRHAGTRRGEPDGYDPIRLSIVLPTSTHDAFRPLSLAAVHIAFLPGGKLIGQWPRLWPIRYSFYQAQAAVRSTAENSMVKGLGLGLAMLQNFAAL